MCVSCDMSIAHSIHTTVQHTQQVSMSQREALKQNVQILHVLVLNALCA